MKLDFKEWLKLQEVGTSTACVAVFARPIGAIVRRDFGVWGTESKKKKHKNS